MNRAFEEDVLEGMKVCDVQHQFKNSQIFNMPQSHAFEERAKIPEENFTDLTGMENDQTLIKIVFISLNWPQPFFEH